MLDNEFLIGAVLVASLGGANDVLTARVPNWLTYSGLLAALMTRFVLLGWPGFKSGVVGMLLAAVVFLVLFMIGAMGGGDVKLMASVSAWAGSNQVLPILLAAALAGGLLALVYIPFRQGFRQTFCHLIGLIRFRLTSGLRAHPVWNVREAHAVRLPFGVAIAVGTAFCAGNAIWWR